DRWATRLPAAKSYLRAGKSRAFLRGVDLATPQRGQPSFARLAVQRPLLVTGAFEASPVLDRGHSRPPRVTPDPRAAGASRAVHVPAPGGPAPPVPSRRRRGSSRS